MISHTVLWCCCRGYVGWVCCCELCRGVINVHLPSHTLFCVVCDQLEDITGRKHSHRVLPARPTVCGDAEVLVKVWEVLQEGKGPFVVNSYHFPAWGDMTEGAGIIMYESLIHVSQNSRQEVPDVDFDDESVHIGGTTQQSLSVGSPVDSSPILTAFAQPQLPTCDHPALPPPPSMPPPPPPPSSHLPPSPPQAQSTGGAPAPPTAPAPTRNLSTSSRDAFPTAADRPCSGQLGNLSQYIGIFNQMAPRPAIPRRHSTATVSATAAAAALGFHPSIPAAATPPSQQAPQQPVCTGHNSSGLVTTPPSPPAASAAEDWLPAGWEQKVTPAGKYYYVNHVTKTTQWERPNTDKSG